MLAHPISSPIFLLFSLPCRPNTGRQAVIGTGKLSRVPTTTVGLSVPSNKNIIPLYIYSSSTQQYIGDSMMKIKKPQAQNKYIDNYHGDTTMPIHKPRGMPIIKLARRDCNDFNLSISKYKRKSLLFHHLTPLPESQRLFLGNYSTVSSKSVVSSPPSSVYNPQSAYSSPVRSKLFVGVQKDEIQLSKTNQQKEHRQRQKYKQRQKQRQRQRQKYIHNVNLHERYDPVPILLSKSQDKHPTIKLKEESMGERVKENIKRYQSSYQRSQHRNMLSHPQQQGSLLQLHYQLKKKLERNMLARIQQQQAKQFHNLLHLHQSQHQ